MQRKFNKAFAEVQAKTFTKWFNSKLKDRDLSPIENVGKDLTDGVKLIELLEIIGGEPMGRYNKTPKLRLQKIENLNKALTFIKNRGVHLTNIGSEDIVDGNSKLGESCGVIDSTSEKIKKN